MNLIERARAGVARVDPALVPDLRSFQAVHFGAGSRQASPSMSAWRFRPAGPDQAPLFWICRREGAIVGQQGGLPATVQSGAGSVEACWAVDLLVEPSWRLKGVGPALSGALVESVPLTLGLGISEAAVRAFRRAGWLDLGPVPRLARLLRPLDSGLPPLGTSWVPGAGISRLSRVAAPLFAAHDLAALPVARGGTALEALSRVDERMEAVWRAAAPSWPAAVRRDLAWLAWRFDESPQAGLYERWLLTRRGEPVAYAVTRRRGVALVTVDYFCRPGDVRPLFAHLLMLGRELGASLVTCLAAPRAVRRSLVRLGFVEREGPRFMIHSRAAPAAPVEVPDRAEGWFLTDADCDLDHGPKGEVHLSDPVLPAVSRRQARGVEGREASP